MTLISTRICEPTTKYLNNSYTGYTPCMHNRIATRNYKMEDLNLIKCSCIPLQLIHSQYSNSLIENTVIDQVKESTTHEDVLWINKKSILGQEHKI